MLLTETISPQVVVPVSEGCSSVERLSFWYGDQIVPLPLAARPTKGRASRPPSATPFDSPPDPHGRRTVRPNEARASQTHGGVRASVRRSNSRMPARLPRIL